MLGEMLLVLSFKLVNCGTGHSQAANPAAGAPEIAWHTKLLRQLTTAGRLPEIPHFWNASSVRAVSLQHNAAGTAPTDDSPQGTACPPHLQIERGNFHLSKKPK